MRLGSWKIGSWKGGLARWLAVMWTLLVLGAGLIIALPERVAAAPVLVQSAQPAAMTVTTGTYRPFQVYESSNGFFSCNNPADGTLIQTVSGCFSHDIRTWVDGSNNYKRYFICAGSSPTLTVHMAVSSTVSSYWGSGCTAYVRYHSLDAVWPEIMIYFLNGPWNTLVQTTTSVLVLNESANVSTTLVEMQADDFGRGPEDRTGYAHVQICDPQFIIPVTPTECLMTLADFGLNAGDILPRSSMVSAAATKVLTPGGYVADIVLEAPLMGANYFVEGGTSNSKEYVIAGQTAVAHRMQLDPGDVITMGPGDLGPVRIWNFCLNPGETPCLWPGWPGPDPMSLPPTVTVDNVIVPGKNLGGWKPVTSTAPITIPVYDGTWGGGGGGTDPVVMGFGATTPITWQPGGDLPGQMPEICRQYLKNPTDPKLRVYWWMCSGYSGAGDNFGDPLDSYASTGDDLTAKQLVLEFTAVSAKGTILYITIDAGRGDKVTHRLDVVKGTQRLSINMEPFAERRVKFTFRSVAPVTLNDFCFTYGSGYTGAYRDRFFWHPVCERDWEVKEDYRAAFPALLIGRNAPGIPIHAIGAGTIRPFSMSGGPGIASEGLMLDGVSYKNCVYIDHGKYLYDDETNMQATSIYCNVEQGSSSARPVSVKRGQLIGHTLTSYNGNAVVALQLGGILIDPQQYYGAFPDCRTPHLTIERLPGCEGDNGNGTFIQGRHKTPFPALPTIDPSWNLFSGFFPFIQAFIKWLGDVFAWLGNLLYDWVGYPILCASVDLYNGLASALEKIVNWLIDAWDVVGVFIYRIWMVVKHILMRLGELFMGVMTAIFSYADGTICIKNVMIYFVQALYYSAIASADISGDLNANSGFAVGLAVINSTVASTFMLPMTMLLIGWLARKLVIWTINKFARTFKSGERS